MTNSSLSPGPVPRGGGAAASLDDLTDRQLLERFVKQSDGAAFERLVKRYGPMVLNVCRRVLGNAEEADDAFQATFLVLVRRAATIEMPDLIGNWLYGVASRVARKARAQMIKRSQRKPPEAAVSSTDPQLEAALRELQAQLDEELEQLPMKYRAPLVLCYLEGLSNREAAQRLGWPIGSISHRLTRGREMLRKRLSHRHPNASYLVLGALPIWAIASSDTLAQLTELVVRLGSDLERDAATSSVSQSVQAMTDSVQRTSDRAFQGKAPARRTLTIFVALAALLALAATAATSWAYHGPTQTPPASADAPATGGCHPAPPIAQE